MAFHLFVDDGDLLICITLIDVVNVGVALLIYLNYV